MQEPTPEDCLPPPSVSDEPNCQQSVPLQSEDLTCENRRYCGACGESIAETLARTKNKAAYKRAKVVQAILNALPQALIPRNIESAWKASHLFPFRRDPPESKEKEENVVKQLAEDEAELAKAKKKKEDSIFKTGLISHGPKYDELRVKLAVASPSEVEHTCVPVNLESLGGGNMAVLHLDVHEADVSGCSLDPDRPNTVRLDSPAVLTLSIDDKDSLAS